MANKPMAGSKYMKKQILDSTGKATSIRKAASVTVTLTMLAGGLDSAFGAGIAGTSHDMSAKGWGTTELCRFCHTPHMNQNVLGAPLWNHKTTVAVYSLYSSATFAGAGTLAQPGPTSKLCLSCHDGTVASDSFGNGGVLATGTHFMPSTNQIGAASSLTRDHPIGFDYNAALVSLDPALKTPVSASFVDTARTVPLYASKMECASCHATHDNTYGKFLRSDNTGSALCLKCHIK